MYDLNRERTAERLRPLAEFGLLLMVLAGGTEYLIRNNEYAAQNPVSLICEINAEGNIVRSFGKDVLRGRCGIAVAPESCRHHGFTPGNLYVQHALCAGDNLNRYAISEFSSDGRLVKTISGGREIGTRLAGPAAITFLAEGTLLVPSGGWTDAILMLLRGGASICRFINLCSNQVVCGPDERIYAIYASSAGDHIRVYNKNGHQEQILAPTAPGISYFSIAVNSRRQLWAIRLEQQQKQVAYSLVKYTEDGTELQALDLPGIDRGYLAVDKDDNLYVPCARTGELCILDHAGKIIRRISLRGRLCPNAVAIGSDGRIWVAGSIINS
jgi:hypothetical protein